MKAYDTIYKEIPSEIIIDLPPTQESYQLKKSTIRKFNGIINSHWNLVNYTRLSKIFFIFFVEINPRKLTPLIDSLKQIGVVSENLVTETYSHNHFEKKKTALKIHLRFPEADKESLNDRA
jgi:hypothetical protein